MRKNVSFKLYDVTVYTGVVSIERTEHLYKHTNTQQQSKKKKRRKKTVEKNEI